MSRRTPPTRLWLPATAGAAALLGGAGGLRAVAQKPAPPAQPSGYVEYSAGYASWLNAPHTVEMSRGVQFQHEDATLRTQAAIATLNAQQELLTAKSLAPVRLTDPQDDLTGQKGFVDFTRHLATLDDNVTLVVKPGTREATAPPGSLRRRFQDAATLTCQEMTYDYRHKTARVPGPLTVRQKDRELQADSGDYDARKQVITLHGHVHGRNAQGEEVETTEAVIGIKEGQEFLQIPVPTHGRFKVKEESDDTSDAQNPPPAAPPAPAGPPPASAREARPLPRGEGVGGGSGAAH